MSAPTHAPERHNEKSIGPVVQAPIQWRFPIAAIVMAVLTIGFAIISKGESVFSMAGASRAFDIPNWHMDSTLVVWILAALAVAFAAGATFLAVNRKKHVATMTGLAAVAFILAFLVWIVAGRTGAHMPVVQLLQGAVAFAVPLILGALSGVVCERSGIINIAIEGQLLAGAFMGAVVASISNSPVLGMLLAPIAGMLVALLLGLFTIKYRVDHIIVGVVLNMLVLGLTSFLYSSWLTSDPGHLNKAMALSRIRIPLLADIPVIGPVFFNQTILVYLMYIIVIVLQFMLFRSRWGLRLRACGEHPKAADTVGIKVNRTRWRSVILGGALAGLGGAFFTVGIGLAFTKNAAAGNGFIALAAMILGRWNPKDAVAAAAIFGFATNLGYVMQSVNNSIPYEFLLMIPYVVTILAVAGFVGAVRPPAMEGKPYP
ncbi:ABC transporter permease [Bowdeniella nasicola]|uniref:ABC transporter permease n=1 Tax=Bowdeniella nasicola TaxID=208480 RepID=A0A1Q5PZU4_9ACTO|nr:ABC transporter permease [Bowdeniella nasicola]OKL53151.1 ABC transporter permease [Bowdeniella nasicola]